MLRLFVAGAVGLSLVLAASLEARSPRTPSYDVTWTTPEEFEAYPTDDFYPFGFTVTKGETDNNYAGMSWVLSWYDPGEAETFYLPEDYGTNGDTFWRNNIVNHVTTWSGSPLEWTPGAMPGFDATASMAAAEHVTLDWSFYAVAVEPEEAEDWGSPVAWGAVTFYVYETPKPQLSELVTSFIRRPLSTLRTMVKGD